MAIGTTTALILTTVVAAASAYAQGQAAKRQSNMQADLTDQQSARDKQIGELNAAREKKKNKTLQAQQRAALAANGADLSQGSALLAQEDLVEEGDLNERLVRNNADAQVYAGRTQANLTRAAGSSKQTASYVRAGTTLLKGGNEMFG